MSRAAPPARAVVALVGAMLLAGCGLFGRDDPTVGGSARPSDAATVTIVDAGAEPRRPLSFSFEEGSSVDLELAFDLHLSQRASDDDPAQVLDPPTTEQTIRFTVERADDTGADVTFEVLAAGIDRSDTALTDAQVWELTASLQAAVGVHGRLRITPQGRLESVSYEPSDAMEAGSADVLRSLEQGLSNVVPVLPAEPLGRGARWRTVARTTVGDVTVRQTANYELTALADDHLLYRATLTQDAVEQDLDGGDGTGAEVLAADLSGTVTGMTSLVSLASESETSISGSQVIEHTLVGREPQRVTQEIGVTVEIGPSPG